MYCVTSSDPHQRLLFWLLTHWDGFLFVCLQEIISEINHAIGATGIISGECKTVVEKYSDFIIQLLMSEVSRLIKFAHIMSCYINYSIGVQNSIRNVSYEYQSDIRSKQ